MICNDTNWRISSSFIGETALTSGGCLLKQTWDLLPVSVLAVFCNL